MIARRAAQRAVGDAIRAELARKRKTQADLAKVLNLNAGTVSRRLSGEAEFTVTEIVSAAIWLDVPFSTFMPPDDAPASPASARTKRGAA